MQNKANLARAKMNASSTITKDYENKCPRRPHGKQSQTKPIRGKANVKMAKLCFSQCRTPTPQSQRDAAPA